MSRMRVYASNAERQAAYRARRAVVVATEAVQRLRGECGELERLAGLIEADLRRLARGVSGRGAWALRLRGAAGADVVTLAAVVAAVVVEERSCRRRLARAESDLERARRVVQKT